MIGILSDKEASFFVLPEDSWRWVRSLDWFSFLWCTVGYTAYRVCCGARS